MATSPEKAEQILCNHRITHLDCDNDLGMNSPKGSELIPKWRDSFSEIQWAVLVSGHSFEGIHSPEGIDLQLSKTASLQDILTVI